MSQIPVSQNPKDVVDELLAAVHADDQPRIEQVFHPELAIHEPENLPYPGTYRGVAGFHAIKAKIGELAELGIEDWDAVQAGDRVLVTMTGVFTSKRSGRTVRMPMVELYSVRDGRISEIDVFYKDTAKMSVLLAELS
ncbi:nuclear transport factor 2 family protein [Nocardioides houyundeii]|uniref:nuclear transport factor 2 family protein n=1 Tax=Nocardioides houyundeii TaxID=2045452 RepID=UPI0013158221|nr:nuclear transport factor 2 family protein [Nocardioides houyundeii]